MTELVLVFPVGVALGWLVMFLVMRSKAKSAQQSYPASQGYQQPMPQAQGYPPQPNPQAQQMPYPAPGYPSQLYPPQ